jgi:hypothetical protein
MAVPQLRAVTTHVEGSIHMKFNVAVLAVMAATLSAAPVITMAADTGTSGSSTSTSSGTPKAKHHHKSTGSTGSKKSTTTTGASTTTPPK